MDPAAERSTRARPRSYLFDPWLIAVGALVFGVVVGDAAHRDAVVPGAFAALAGSLVLLRLRKGTEGGSARAALRLGVVLAFVGVGALRVAAIPAAHESAEAGALVTVEGTLVRAPPRLAQSSGP